MTTNAERVQRAILFAADNPALPLGARVELALICEAAGIEHETLRDVVHGLAGGVYTDQFANSELIDQQWVHAVMTDSVLPALTLPDEDGLPLTHAVFWSTNFGRAPMASPPARDRVLSALEAEASMETIGEYLIALIGLGAALPQEALSQCVAFYDAAEWGADYHTYFAMALLFALIGD